MAILKFPKQNLYEVIEPFFYILKFCNYACFTIKGKITDGIIYTSRIDFCIYFSYLCSNLSVLYLSFTYDSGIRQSVVLEIGTKCVLWFSLIIAIIASTLVFIFRHKAWEIIKGCYNFDNQLLYFGHIINHQQHFIAFLLYTIFGVILLIICTIINLRQTKFGWMPFLFCLFANANYMMVLKIFVMFVSSIKIRFSAFNRCFANIFLKTSNKTIKAVQDRNLSDYIKRFGKMYAILNDAVDLLNFCCSMQLMLCFALFFVYTIFTVFAAYRLFVDYDEQSFKIAISSICWDILYLSYSLTIVAVSSSITSEFSWLSQQVGQRIPIVSCGLFSFDWTLFYSIIAASSTYLVILVQFESSTS